MFELNTKDIIRKISWNQIRSGMVFLGGVSINGAVPYELRIFPVMTEELITDVKSKYRLRDDHGILVLNTSDVIIAGDLRNRITDVNAKLIRLNNLRAKFFEEKKYYTKESGLIVNSDIVDKDTLVYDNYNSFDIDLTKIERVPSMFIDDELKITFLDALSGTLEKKIKLPEDLPAHIHIVVDYSYSMTAKNLDNLAFSAVNYLDHMISEMFMNVDTTIYCFSEKLRVTECPLKGDEIERKGTNYSLFLNGILKRKKRDKHNLAVVITDGVPSDYSEACRLAEKLKEEKIDLTLIVLDFFCKEFEVKVYNENYKNSDYVRDGFVTDEYMKVHNTEIRDCSEEETKTRKDIAGNNYKRFVEASGGNLIIMSINETLSCLSVECFDRYMGLLTLKSSKTLDQIANDYKNQQNDIKKFNFRKL